MPSSTFALYFEEFCPKSVTRFFAPPCTVDFSLAPPRPADFYPYTVPPRGLKALPHASLDATSILDGIILVVVVLVLVLILVSVKKSQSCRKPIVGGSETGSHRSLYSHTLLRLESRCGSSRNSSDQCNVL